MSKRNKQSMLYQPASPAKKRAMSSKTNVKTNAKNPQNSAGKARPISRGAQVFERPSYDRTVMAVRITVIVIAVLALAGGVYWAVSIMRGGGSFTPAQVVGLIALGFVAGLAIAIAMRTREIVAQVMRVRRERAQR